ncbi:MAG: OmpH family outer membrane protein, partial [Flavobacteriales bacterium]
QQKEQELLQPILKKAQNAIDEVADKGKYTYILDSSAGLILYSKDSEDILDKVKKELGL